MTPSVSRRETPADRRASLVDWGIPADRVDALNRRSGGTLFERPVRTVGTKLDCIAGLGFTRAQAVKIVMTAPAILSSSVARIEGCFRHFVDALGFTETQVRKMALNSPANLVYASARHDEIFSVFRFRGFTPDRTRALVLRNSRMLGMQPDAIKARFRQLAGYGIPDAKIVGMVVAQPVILMNALARNDAARDTLIGMHGFTPAEATRAITLSPVLLCFRIARTDEVIRNLLAYGYDMAQVRRLATTSNMAISSSVHRTNALFAAFEATGRDRAAVRAITLKMPAVFSSSVARLAEIAAIYAKAGVSLDERPNGLMFSAQLLRARLTFFRARAIAWSNCDLFMSSPDFLKKFGLSRAAVVDFDPGRDAFLAA